MVRRAEPESVKPLTHNALKACILQYLTLRGWLCWANNTGAYAIEDDRHQRRFVRFGKNGSGDIFALHDHQFYSIEVKVGRDRLRSEQEEWMEQVRAHGGVAVVARCLDDVRML
ncbi:VRR-NUC domain-containing protein [Gammaproteobacteria bacterium]